MNKKFLAGILGVCLVSSIVVLPSYSLVDGGPGSRAIISDTTQVGRGLAPRGERFTTLYTDSSRTRIACYVYGEDGACGLDVNGNCTGTITFKYRNGSMNSLRTVKCRKTKNSKCHAPNPCTGD